MITNENYFSPEMSKKFWSNSQFKSFKNCSASAMAELKAEFSREKTKSLLVGSYIDSHFERSLDLFKAQNPDIFTRTGTLRSEFKQAESIIERIEQDERMMKYLDGTKQVIKSGEIEGIPFKIKMDAYHQGKCIVDLKIMKDLKPQWKDGVKLNFIEYWGYDFQAAIYQHIEGNRLPFYFVIATKETTPDIVIIEMSQERMDYCLDIVKNEIDTLNQIKRGNLEPERCEKCSYCRQTKQAQIITYDDLDEYAF